jgi:hypothetical protein
MARKLMRRLADLQILHGFDVIARWVPRQFNKLADLLSRQVSMTVAIRALTDPALMASLQAADAAATDQRLDELAATFPAQADKLRARVAEGRRRGWGA